jgi:perosamine synthetase
MSAKQYTFFGFAPNMTKESLRLSLRLLLPTQWGKWYTSEPVAEVESLLSKHLSGASVYTIDSGRSALYLALQTLGVKAGDEVVVSGYTCIVVPNAIVALGATPVYVDIDDQLCIDPVSLKARITPKTKAIILQHTFGYPGQLTELLRIAKEAGIPTIEDCAHSLGSMYEGKPLGTFGDLAILSFGTEKIISSIRGGAVVVNNPIYVDGVKKKINALSSFPRLLLFRHLLYYPAAALVRSLFSVGLSGHLFTLLRVTHILPKIVSDGELKGKQDTWTPVQFPGALAMILLIQLRHLNTILEQRKTLATVVRKSLSTKCAQTNEEGITPLFVGAYTDVPDITEYHLRQAGIIISALWSNTPIVPDDAKREAVGYVEGCCPKAEQVAKHIFVFGTHPSVALSDDQQRIIAGTV